MNTTFKTDGRIGHQMGTRFEFHDDFFKVNDEDWIATGDSPTVLQSNDAGFQNGGWAEFTTTGTDNDEGYWTTGAWYLCDLNKRFALAARIACTEAATNAANWMVGFLNAGAANALVDNGGGPIVAADKALFYKVDGTMQINAVTAKTPGTTVNVKTSTSLKAAVSGTIYELEIVYEPSKRTGDIGVFHYWIDGVELATHPVTAGTATTSLTAQPTARMTPVIGIKAGTGAAQNLHVDYLAVYADK